MNTTPKTGTVNTAKVIGILNRLRIAPESERRAIINELISAADEVREPSGIQNRLDAVASLRDALNWPEVKASPLALSRVCRALRAARET